MIDIVFWGILTFFAFKKMQKKKTKYTQGACMISAIICALYIIKGVFYVL